MLSCSWEEGSLRTKACWEYTGPWRRPQFSNGLGSIIMGGLQKEVRGRGDMRIVSLSLTLLCDCGPET